MNEIAKFIPHVWWATTYCVRKIIFYYNKTFSTTLKLIPHIKWPNQYHVLNNIHPLVQKGLRVSSSVHMIYNFKVSIKVVRLLTKMVIINNKVVNDLPVSSSISWKPFKEQLFFWSNIYILSCLYIIYPLMWRGWKNPKKWFWHIYECNHQFSIKFQKTTFMTTSYFFHENYWFFYVFDITGTNDSFILIFPYFSPISFATILITVDILCCQLLLKLSIKILKYLYWFQYDNNV
jgi:hypothetical protein